MSEKNVLELELERLRRQNRRLKKRLAARQEIESGKDTPESELETVRLENESLRRSLKRSKELEDDIAAQKLFEKAKSLLVTWLTIGGATVAVVGVLGFMKMNDYAKTLIDKKLETVTAENVNQTFQKEAEQQVSKFFQQQQNSLNDFAQKKTLELLALQPIGRSEFSSREQTSFAGVTVTHVDYTADMTPVRDQGAESSIAGFATAAAVEYQIYKKTGEKVVISPRQIYNLARKSTGLQAQDSGAFLHDAIKVVTSTGAVREVAWPYRDGEYAAQAPTSLEGAPHFKMREAHLVTNLSDLKSALQTSGPVISGISFDLSTEFDKVGKDGIIPTPQKRLGSQMLVAFCAVGFDDQKRLVKFKVSWGPNFGDHGYVYLSYDYLSKNLSNESYAVSY